jgi:hypothetical protein
MPKTGEGERKLLLPGSGPLSEAARALVIKAEPALKLAEEASRLSHCDWELDYSLGHAMPLPHLGRMQELTQLMLLKARMAEEQGALEQHRVMLRMARHVAVTPLLLSRLAGAWIEVGAITSMAAMLPQWSRATRAMARDLVAEPLLPVPSYSACVLFEGKHMGTFFSRTLEDEVREAGGSLDVFAWSKRMGASPSELIKLRTSKLPAGALPKDAPAARRMVESFRSQTKEIARITTLPREAMLKEAAAFEQRLSSGERHNFLIQELRPILFKHAENEWKLIHLRQLLGAAFEVQEKGAAALPPGLATYRKTEGGFELTGKDLFFGKPVVLTVGPK